MIEDVSTPQARGRLRSLAEPEFIALWEAEVGGPPAIMLERDEMIDILAEATSSCDPPDRASIGASGSDPDG